MGLPRKITTLCALAALVAPGGACAQAPEVVRIEDQARAMTPVPACILPLPPRSTAAAGTMRNLKEEQYWPVVFPAFDSRAMQLPVDAVACTGARVFDDPIFAGGTTRGAPAKVESGDIVYGNGGDRIRILWMRTHHWPDGSEAGPLALVRTKEDFSEVYAVGAFRRAQGKATFQVERLGTEYVIAAGDDGCEGRPATAACLSTLSLFLPRFGKLVNLATLAIEQRAYAKASEPGVPGDIEYRLTASPLYVPEGVELFERVQATDSTGRVLRKTELERRLLLKDGVLDLGDGSIWGKAFPGATASR